MLKLEWKTNINLTKIFVAKYFFCCTKCCCPAYIEKCMMNLGNSCWSRKNILSCYYCIFKISHMRAATIQINNFYFPNKNRYRSILNHTFFLNTFHINMYFWQKLINFILDFRYESRPFSIVQYFLSIHINILQL